MREQDRTARPPDAPEPAVESPEASPAVERQTEPSDEWPWRRPLIRATLTLPEGTPSVQREPPVFTMHQQQARGGAGGNRANGNVRDGNTAWDGGQPHKAGGNGRPARSSRRNERGGQSRGGSPQRSGSSRRGRGRSR